VRRGSREHGITAPQCNNVSDEGAPGPEEEENGHRGLSAYFPRMTDPRPPDPRVRAR